MKLFFIDGQKKGDSFELSPPGASIGRELDNDIVLEGEGESRYHAKLETDGKNWKIKDLGSTNGTKHNGIKLTPNEAEALNEGDTLSIGKQTMLFAEKLPEKVDEIIVIDPKEDKKEDSKEDEKEDPKEEKKDETSAPSIIAIKAPSPSEETLPNQDPIKKSDVDAKSSKSFSDFFDDKEENGKNGLNSFSESTDFFGKTKQNLPEVKKGDKKKHAGILFYVGVLGVAIILIGIFILVEQNKKPPETSTPTVKKKTGAPLLIRYEKQVTSTKPQLNIFRYLMEIKYDKVTITIDDLRAQYKKQLSRNVSEEDLNDLENVLRETNFMQSEQPQRGILQDDKDKLQVLTIAYGKEMNSVIIKNSPETASFLEARNALEDFSDNVLKIPPISRTPEEMKETGISAYRKAKLLYDNYQAKHENLYSSIKYFNLALENLDGFKYLPEYIDAYKYKQEAELMLKKDIARHSSNYERYRQLGDLINAKKECQMIMLKKEPGSEAYKKAKKYIFKIDKLIKQRK